MQGLDSDAGRRRKGTAASRGVCPVIESDPPSEDPNVTWVLVDHDAVPARWADRARNVAVIPLLADESADLLNGEPVSRMDDTDERLLRLIGRGLSSKAIAARLRISERTVDRRVARLKNELGARSRFDLARIAGALTPDMSDFPESEEIGARGKRR